MKIRETKITAKTAYTKIYLDAREVIGNKRTIILLLLLVKFHCWGANTLGCYHLDIQSVLLSFTFLCWACLLGVQISTRLLLLFFLSDSIWKGYIVYDYAWCANRLIDKDMDCILNDKCRIRFGFKWKYSRKNKMDDAIIAGQLIGGNNVVVQFITLFLIYQ